jgi:hypothetical protein
MTDLEQRIKKIRAEQSARTSHLARAEVELDAARRRELAAMAALAKEFQVLDLDEARTLLKQAEDDLAAETSRLEHALGNARGPE